jgi:hypothetical protein
LSFLSLQEGLWLHPWSDGWDVVGETTGLQYRCHSRVCTISISLYRSLERFLDRPLVGGISGGKDGAYSVALSGGYDDDVDLGYALCVLFLSFWLDTDGLIL